MIRLTKLRYCRDRWTGICVQVNRRNGMAWFVVGLRWYRRVYNAPAGLYCINYETGRQLHAYR